MNLSGLMNEPAYLRTLADCSIVRYADREGIEYFADYFPADPFDHTAWDDGLFARRCWSTIFSSLRRSGRTLEVLRHWPERGATRPGAGYYVLGITKPPGKS